ncbi:MAG: ABC transporter substrate-binding protein [Candidatus Thermoplasmatota archaeon]|nr:ABC transporter substrate-binding protein [Candidatus Thermoplasmatota archaeon]
MPEKTGWTGTQVGVLVILLVVTNAVTGAVVFFAFPAAPAGPAALTVLHPWSGGERDLFLPVLENFTAQTGIEVNDRIFRQEALQPLLPIQFEAGQTPGDVIFMPSSFILGYAADGHVADVSTVVDRNDYISGTGDLVRSGGTQWGGVYTAKPKPGFWYKVSTFEANSWEQNPSTFAEFTALLDTIVASGQANPIVNAQDLWPISDVTEYIIATYGGAQMHRDLTEGTLAWTDQTVVDVFDTYVEPLVQYFDDPVEWTLGVQDVIADTNSLYFMGFWLPTMFPDDLDPNDWRVMTLPGGATDAGVVNSVDFVFVPKYTDMMTEAMQLLEFLVSADGQNAQVAQGGHVATHVDVGLAGYPDSSADALASAQAAITGREFLPDMDDTVGGDWQIGVFWAQLGLLFTAQAGVTEVLAAIEAGR